MHVNLHVITKALQTILDERCVGPGDQIYLSALRARWPATGLRLQDFDTALRAVQIVGAGEVIPSEAGEALFVLGPVVLHTTDNPMLRVVEKVGTVRTLRQVRGRRPAGGAAGDDRRRPN